MFAYRHVRSLNTSVWTHRKCFRCLEPRLTCASVPLRRLWSMRWSPWLWACALHQRSTCCKRSVSTLSQTLVLLVFFCFLVVLFSIPPPRHSFKKRTCILTLIKREKRGKHQAMEARLSPTCGHVEPWRRGRCACYPHQTPSVSPRLI